MSVLAVIPARLGATRLPRKPLRLLGGIPLIVRVYQRVAAMQVADRCVVATDDDEVMQTCRAHHVPCELTATSHPSGTDRVAEVVRLLADPHVDVVLNVQGDEPFVGRHAVVGAVDIVRAGVADIGTAALRAGPDALARPDVVKVVCTDAGRALYFSRAPIPFLRDPADAASQEGMIRQHLGVYAYSPAALATWVALPPHALELTERLEQLRPLAHGLSIGVVTVSDASGGIDTEADLVHANERWSRETPQSTNTRDD